MRRPFVIALFATYLALSSVGQAQGLIWSLPPDGAWVRYQGDYTQTVRRPNSSQGDLDLEWRRFLTIKSVGQLDVSIAGEVAPVPCRWIEIKVETGVDWEGVLNAGPGGIRIYKLLVREDAIEGSMQREIPGVGSIFVSFIPLVQGTTMQDGMEVEVGPGWRKLGELPAERLEGDVFQLYPAVSLLRHYRDLQSQGNPQPIQSDLGGGTATVYTGSMQMETSARRSTNTGEMLRSDDIPFGLFSWTATTISEKKVTVEPRSAFAETVVITEEMTLVEGALSGAETELAVDDEF